LVNWYEKGYLKKKPRALIILDDANASNLNLRSGKEKDEWLKVMTVARQYGISFIFVFHTPHDTIPPGLKAQINRFYVFKNMSQYEVLFKWLPITKVGNTVIRSASRLKLFLSDALVEKYTCVFYDMNQNIYGEVIKIPLAPADFVIQYQHSFTLLEKK
jgi:hypothetical protein